MRLNRSIGTCQSSSPNPVEHPTLANNDVLQSATERLLQVSEMTTDESRKLANLPPDSILVHCYARLKETMSYLIQLLFDQQFYSSRGQDRGGLTTQQLIAQLTILSDNWDNFHRQLDHAGDTANNGV